MTSLVLCGCGLAKHAVAVEGEHVSAVIYLCEHCDAPCADRRCRQCDTLYGAKR